MIMVLISLCQTTPKFQTKISDLNFRTIIMVSLAIISLPSGIKFLIEDGDVPRWFGGLIVGLCLFVGYLLFTEKNSVYNRQLEVDKSLFKTDRFFNVSAFLVTLILAFIYTVWW